MLEYDRIDISEGIDINKCEETSRECSLCKFDYFLHKNFNYSPYLCNGCYMSLKAVSMQNLTIINHKIDKKESYSSKKAISLDSIDLDKIVVSSKWKINETTYKYLCGYLNNDVIQPLCVILPQMNGYIKYFDNGGKNDICYG